MEQGHQKVFEKGYETSMQAVLKLETWDEKGLIFLFNHTGEPEVSHKCYPVLSEKNEATGGRDVESSSRTTGGRTTKSFNTLAASLKNMQ